MFQNLIRPICLTGTATTSRLSIARAAAARRSLATASSPTKQKVLKITIMHKRKEGVSEEDFQRFLTVRHAGDAVPIHKRHGVLKFSITHTPSSARNIIAPTIASKGGNWRVADFDATTEFYVYKLQDILAVLTDPEWASKIAPEDAKYADVTEALTTAGWEEVYIENGEIVNIGGDGRSTYPAEHGI